MDDEIKRKKKYLKRKKKQSKLGLIYQTHNPLALDLNSINKLNTR